MIKSKRNVFCIIGKSGSGKNFYFDKIIEDKKFVNYFDLNQLVLGTTREIRQEETNGREYYFYSDEEFKDLLKNHQNEIIEYRKYDLLDKDIYYFTLSKFFKINSIAAQNRTDKYSRDEPWHNIICIVSPAQFDAYRKYFNNCDVNLYTIEIECNLRNRLNQSLERAITDDQLLEVCRRALYGEEEFQTINFTPDLKINNNDFAYTKSNIYSLKGFIHEKIKISLE